MTDGYLHVLRQNAQQGKPNHCWEDTFTETHLYFGGSTSMERAYRRSTRRLILRRGRGLFSSLT
jgi:hypothetical protein